MYNNILPQKCIVNILIFFQKFNTVFFFFKILKSWPFTGKAPSPLSPKVPLNEQNIIYISPKRNKQIKLTWQQRKMI